MPFDEKEYQREYRKKNKEKVREYNKGYRKRVFTDEQKEKRRLYVKQYDIDNKERIKERKRLYYLKNKIHMLARQKAYTKRISRLVFEHYGLVCKCCGESTIEFLAIDHINGGGRQHKIKEKWYHLHAWLYQRGYPEGYQTLCHNCNFSKWAHGICPHQRDKQ